MAQGLRLHRLAAELRLADGAIDDVVIAALRRAGGRDLVLPHRLGGGMAQGLRLHRLAADLRLTDGAIDHAVIAALRRAGGGGLVFLHRLGGGMAQGLRLHRLAAELRLADGAIDDSVIAALCRTGSRDLVLPHRLGGSMVQGRGLHGYGGVQLLVFEDRRVGDGAALGAGGESYLLFDPPALHLVFLWAMRAFADCGAFAIILFPFVGGSAPLVVGCGGFGSAKFVGFDRFVKSGPLEQGDEVLVLIESSRVNLYYFRLHIRAPVRVISRKVLQCRIILLVHVRVYPPAPAHKGIAGVGRGDVLA